MFNELKFKNAYVVIYKIIILKIFRCFFKLKVLKKCYLNLNKLNENNLFSKLTLIK
ncbi:hypothetical protein NUSPORA_00903 [Nucleospora cyclopteri]